MASWVGEEGRRAGCSRILTSFSELSMEGRRAGAAACGCDLDQEDLAKIREAGSQQLRGEVITSASLGKLELREASGNKASVFIYARQLGSISGL